MLDSYKKSPSLSAVPDAVNSLTLAITLLTEQGRFRQAADRQKEVGNILKEGGDLPAARDAFEKAGEWYSMEDANAWVALSLALNGACDDRPGWLTFDLLNAAALRTANAILKEAAELSGTLGDYKRAVDVFVQVGEWSLTSPLTKYSVKELWLKAGLWCVPLVAQCRCRTTSLTPFYRSRRPISALASEDVVLARNLLDKFAQQGPSAAFPPSLRASPSDESRLDARTRADLSSATVADRRYLPVDARGPLPECDYERCC